MGNTTGRRVPLSEEEKAYIREYLPQSTCNQVAKDLGRWSAAVSYFARREGIKPSAEAARKNKEEGLHRWLDDNLMTFSANVSAARRRTIRKERLRISWGIDQRTKLRLNGLPKKILNARHHLHGRNGYILEDCHLDDSDPYIIYYDSETKRTPNEAYFAEKYGFTFLPLDE